MARKIEIGTTETQRAQRKTTEKTPTNRQDAKDAK